MYESIIYPTVGLELGLTMNFLGLETAWREESPILLYTPRPIW